MDIKDFGRAIADEKTLQIHRRAGWIKATPEEALDRMCGNPAQVRIAPTLTPVDMSVLVGSGIDCTFEGSDGDYRHGPLTGCALGSYECGRPNDGYTNHSQCRPRMDHWHSARNCKITAPNAVIMLQKAGFSAFAEGDQFMVEGPAADRYCYPWESDQ